MRQPKFVDYCTDRVGQLELPISTRMRQTEVLGYCRDCGQIAGNLVVEVRCDTITSQDM